MYTARNTGTRRKRNNRVIIDKHQNKFPKGYISTISDSRMPEDALSDMLNMEMVQDNIPRPRPSTVPYGEQPNLPVVGRGEYRYNGQRSLLWMFNDGGSGKVYEQTDGGIFTEIGGDYDVSVWSSFAQSASKVYVHNTSDKLSHVNLETKTVVTHDELDSPLAPSGTKSGSLSGTTFPAYYKVTANNEVGESAASLALFIEMGKLRDDWSPDLDSIDLSWTAVPNADSYTIYVGTAEGQEQELITINGLSYTDKGTVSPNPFKVAPKGNSTGGEVFTWMYVDRKNAQLIGITSDNKLYYASPGSGDFSPYNGGGFVTIDEGGDTQLNYVTVFRNGRGEPVITTSSRGASGKGIIHHAGFQSLTIGDQVIPYLDVYPANGQSATYSARGVIRARDSMYYPTGEDFKTTGTSQNIVNILTTNTISQVINDEDVPKINRGALDKSVGLEYKDKLYWALPVGSSENTEIWYMDLSRKNMWVLRWTIPAKDMWLYEDNDGDTHFCVLVNDRILEITRRGNQTTQDDGVPFRTRLSFNSLVWDEDGITLASIYRMYFKLLRPRGNINISATGLTKRGVTGTLDSETFTTAVSSTGIGVWDYSGDYMYGDPVGSVETYNRAIAVVPLKPKGKLNQLDWEIITEESNCDYILSSVNTRGTAGNNQIYSR